MQQIVRVLLLVIQVNNVIHHKLWDDLNSVVDEFLSDISITDLVEKPKDPHIVLKEIKS